MIKVKSKNRILRDAILDVDKNTFKIVGVIDNDTLTELLNHFRLRGRDRVTVLIYSGGGDANIALTINKLLSEMDSTAIAFDACHSAAATIFMGAKKRYCIPTSSFMIHHGSVGGLTPLFANKYFHITMSNTAKILNEFGIKIPNKMPLIGAEFQKYFTAEEAVKQGIVHKIL